MQGAVFGRLFYKLAWLLRVDTQAEQQSEGVRRGGHGGVTGASLMDPVVQARLLHALAA